jgi:integrase
MHAMEERTGCDTREVEFRPLVKQVVIEQERVGGSSHGIATSVDGSALEINGGMEDMVRQHNDSLQHQQTVVSGVLSSVNEEVVYAGGAPSSGIVSISCERSGQCKGGQPVTPKSVGRLLPSELDLKSHSGGVSDTNSVRSVCLSNESKTSNLLLGISQGPQVSCQGCVQHPVEGVGGSTDSSSHSAHPQVSEENTGRENGGVNNSSALVGSTVDSDSIEDDSEDESSGRVIIDFKTRKDDAQKSGPVTSGPNGSVSGGRRNDPGESLVRNLIAKMGLDDYVDWFFDSVAISTFRNYRRGFTLFDRLVREDGLDPLQVGDAQTALSVLLRSLRLAFQKRVKLSAVLVMKTAVIRLFDFIFNSSLEEIPILKMALKSYSSSFPPKKEGVKLQWSVDQLFRYFLQLPQWCELDFNQLVHHALVLCMAFSTLRFSEILSLNMVDTDPDYQLGVWKFWTQIKGHGYVEPVYLQIVDDPHLNPVGALVEVRKRILALKSDAKSFWFKLSNKNLLPLSHNELRSAAVDVLKLAKISDTKPYHIKHAVLTYLDQNGVSAQGIAAFARHKFGSMMAYKHYISYDGGKASSDILLSSVKNKKKIN